MARRATSRVRRIDPLITFDALSIEGAILQPEMIARIAAREAGEQEEVAYGLDPKEKLREVVQTKFPLVQSLFARFAGSDRGPQALKRFLQNLFAQVFEFTDLEQTGPIETTGRSFPIGHGALGGRVPIVFAPHDKIDASSKAFSDGGRARSPSQMLQEYLNVEDSALWGLVCDGARLRLYRDNAALTRPAYLEADLERILDADTPLMADFSALWMIIHASRFGAADAPVTDCALERWREAGRKQGTIARERLRDGVEKALLELGQGFLEHPANNALRADLHEGRLSPQNYLKALLRLIYRFLFVFTAEDRDLLHIPSPEKADAARAHARAKAIYAKGYSLAKLRERSVKRHVRDRHGDGWEGVTILFRALWRGEPVLSLPALGSLFANDGGPRSFENCALSNARLYEAIFRLAWLRTEAGLERVNWRDMETEELGSVYESLLELTPKLGGPEGFTFIGAAGNSRKTTASYYTPDSLVQALLDQALDPLIEETIKGKEGQAAMEALLSLKIIDPACGSGHFLLAAGRRVAARCAQLASPGAPSASDYRHWLREAARRCLFGVDKNPLAVELAKVALWIETVEPGKPLSFLDAHIRCGDSLLGIYDLDALQKGIPDGAYKPLIGDVKAAASEWRKRNKAEREARAQGELGLIGPPRALMEAARRLEAQEEDNLSAVEAKAKAFQTFLGGEDRHRLETACDLYIAAFLLPKVDPPARLSGDRGAYVPTTRDVWETLSGRQPHGLLIGNAVDAAKTAGAFHWPLEFPQVSASGGFDLVLGNPPWETMSPDAKEFFSPYDPQVRFLSPDEQKHRFEELKALPGVQEQWGAYCDRLYRAAEFMRRSGRYKMFAEGNLGKGDFNVYRLFVELALTAIRPGARAAQFAPENLYNGANAAGIRKYLFANMRLQTLVAFENTKKIWFDIDSRAKFCLYAAIAGGQTTGFDAAFGVNSIEKLQAFGRGHSLQVPVSLVEEFSPEALAISEIAHPFDIEIVKKLYSIFPKFGADNASLAFREYQREIDMGNDRSLFTEDPSGIPIYEGRMVEAFDHRAKAYKSGRGRAAVWDELRFGPEKFIAPQWRILVEDIPSKIQDRWLNPRIGFCDVASPTNQRSLVAAIIPGGTVCGHKVPTITFSPEDARSTCFWLGVANSFCMDFLVRKKVSLTMSFTLMDSLPLPRIYQDSQIERAIASRALKLGSTGSEMFDFWSDTAPLLGLDLGRDAPIEEPSERRRIRTELDILVARDLCGLSIEQFRYLMEPSDILGTDCGFETFGALKRADARNYDGRFETRDEIIAAWDRLERLEIGEDTRVAASAQPPVPVDPAILPDGAWARPTPGTQDVRAATLAQLAALIKALPGPTPIEKVRQAVLYALEPRYLTRRLSGAGRATWLRLVESDAVVASGTNIAAFSPAIDAGWRDAVTQLRGMGAIIENAAANTWAPGARLDEFYTETWPDGRAAFVLKALESMTLDEKETDLPAEDKQWVRANAG